MLCSFARRGAERLARRRNGEKPLESPRDVAHPAGVGRRRDGCQDQLDAGGEVHGLRSGADPRGGTRLDNTGG
jgi:hypothetical protein